VLGLALLLDLGRPSSAIRSISAAQSRPGPAAWALINVLILESSGDWPAG
jgi:hypothetical protein